MAITYYERLRGVGLASGSMWLVIAGMGYSAWSLWMVRTNAASCLLAGILVVGLVLLILGIGTIRGVLRLNLLPEIEASERGRLMLRFAGIVAVEVAAIAVVANICVRTHHWRFIVPLAIVIVGLHFLPLVSLFRVPRYYKTGALFCAIPLGTMLLVPISAQIGHCLSWITIPSVGCGLVALATAWAGLQEVRRFVGAYRAQV